MPQLKLGDKTLEVGRMELTLSPRCGPVLRMRVNPDQEWSELHDKAIGVTEGEVEADGTLKLRFIGYEKHHDTRMKELGEPPTIDAVGLVLEREIQDWFTEKADGADGLLWLIHQRAPDQDGFAFLNQTVEDRFDPTFDVSRIHAVFEPLSCIARHASWSNHRFLEHLTNFMGFRTESVWGWSVFNDKNTPLRLLHHEEPVALDNDWEVPTNQTIPHTLTGAKSFQVYSSFACEKPLKFFERVSSLGKQLYSGKLKNDVPERTAQLMLAPGMVTFKGSRFLCTEIRYLFDADHLTATLTLKEPVWDVPQPLYPSLLFEGEFLQWTHEKDGDGILDIRPTPEGRWSMLDAKGRVDTEMPLQSRIVMPGRSRGELSLQKCLALRLALVGLFLGASAKDAHRGVGHDPQAAHRDGLVALLADAKGALVHPLERVIDLIEHLLLALDKIRRELARRRVGRHVRQVDRAGGAVPRGVPRVLRGLVGDRANLAGELGPLGDEELPILLELLPGQRHARYLGCPYPAPQPCD